MYSTCDKSVHVGTCTLPPPPSRQGKMALLQTNRTFIPTGQYHYSSLSLYLLSAPPPRPRRRARVTAPTRHGPSLTHSLAGTVSAVSGTRHTASLALRCDDTQPVIYNYTKTHTARKKTIKHTNNPTARPNKKEKRRKNTKRGRKEGRKDTTLQKYNPRGTKK